MPYHLGRGTPVDEPGAPIPVARTVAQPCSSRQDRAGSDQRLGQGSARPHRTRIADLVSRQRSTVAGRVQAFRVQPWGGNPALECTLADETGSITVVFFGRREIGGVRLGTIMSVTGVAGEHHGMRAILNPEYAIILSTPTAP